MANHSSAIKRIRANDAKRLRNRYFHKSARTAIKSLRHTSDKKTAAEMLVNVSSMLDKLAKRKVIHKNKAGNLIGKLTRYVNGLK